MAKFYIDTESVQARTYEVEAENEGQARERLIDRGVVVSSETTPETVIKVSVA